MQLGCLPLYSAHISGARCGGRLEVRAVVTDLDLVRRILDAVPRMARAPPPLDSTIAYEPAFA